MSAFIYSLCALTSLACAGLLLRAYARSRHRTLFWSGLCFLMLTASNVLNIFDRFVFPNIDLAPARLLADPRRLKEALINLLANAIEATPPGGRIRLSIRPIMGGGGEACLRDTGRGIRADDLARLVPEYVTLPRGVAASGGEVAWSRDPR